MPSTSKKEKETELIDNLNAIEETKIRVWLVSIKGVTSGTVKNPITKKSINTYTIDKGHVYPMIIKWCLTKDYLKDYDFSEIPNIEEIAKSLGITISSNSPRAARGNTQPPPPPPPPPPTSRLPITTILENWKKNPGINPYTKTQMPILVNPNSEYAKLYKKCIKELVTDVLAKKQGSSSPNKDRLSINDCRYIKECMPTEHAVAEIKGGWRARQTLGIIYYDHLFIKYFISLRNKSTNAKVYNYDVNYTVKYTKDIDVYLYLIVYEIFEKNFKEDPDPTPVKYNIYDTAVKILQQSPYTTLKDSNKYKLGCIVETLCKDIKNVLYMHESKITDENINKANYNKEVLKYIISLTRLRSNNNQIRNELIEYYTQTYFNDLGFFVPAVYNSSINSKSSDHNIHNIYAQIINHIKDPQYRDSNEDILETLLAVYDSILKLYSDNNMKNNVYKKVYDEYKTIPIFEPPIPRREKPIMDLQKYRAVRVFAKHPEKDEFLAGDDEKWRIQLKNYDKERKELKQGRKQDIFDRIYEGKVSPKHKKWRGENLPTHKKAYHSVSSPKKLSQNRYQEYSAIRKPLNAVPPRVSFLKYSHVLKAFALTPSKNESGSGSGSSRKPEDYYSNEADPYTLEDFKDMRSYKRKHTSDIVHIVNGKEFHYRYDTVSLYNAIIDNIRDCTQPVNIAVPGTELTPENLDEVCRKIKKFTKQPTYASSNEINAVLANCKYDNCLELTYLSNPNKGRIRDMNMNIMDFKIVGNYHIYLNLKLGGILFKVINKIAVDTPGDIYDDFPDQTDTRNSIIMTLPILHDVAADICRFDPDYTDGDIMITYLKDRLAKGELLGDKYFPNRKNNEVGRRWNKVVDIPDFHKEFGFDMDENYEITKQKMKDYKAMIALL